MSDKKLEIATVGNGCFWCSEAVFQHLNGVIKIQSGYSGGDMANPDYKTVCTGVTGHAEAIEITYDPEILSFQDLLEVFWNTHDPTTLNRQGNDVGSQYRSVIFYHNEEQKQIAETYMKQLDDSGVYGKPIVTVIEPFTKFYPAEAYHDNYYNLNSSESYCQYVIRPKVEKFQKHFKDKMKTS